VNAVRSLIALLLLLLLPSLLLAQKEANVWYFGYGLGLDFNTYPPTQIRDGSLFTLEGSASIANPTTGALLFYTDGITIWNREHKPMPNGDKLLGHASSTQSALIVPAPGDSTKYFVFTADAGPYINPPNVGVHYSIVDMTLDGGRGDVTVKNIQLLDSATEKLTGVRNCNGEDYWVIAHGAENDFHAFPITNGVAPGKPVISRTGLYHSPLLRASQGYMKASPDGHRLAVVITDQQSYQGSAELFDFNTLTGIVSHPVSLGRGYRYGISFSPDGTKLYVGGSHPTKTFWDALYQFDVQSRDSATIMATKTALINNAEPYSLQWVPLQLAPNGKIYVASEYFGMAMIHNPNLPGVACNFAYGNWTPGNVIRYGLPNFIDGFFIPRDSVGCEVAKAGFVASDTLLCTGQCIDFTNQSSGHPGNRHWTFEGGVPASSDDQNPTSICYPDVGTFTATLIISNSYTEDTAHLTIVVRPDPFVSAGPNLTICSGDSARLLGRGDGMLRWSPATGLSCIDCEAPSARPGSSTTYVLTAISEDGCIAADSVTVTVASTVEVIAEGGRMLCHGDSTQLHASGANRYSWFPADGLSCTDCADPVAAPDTTTTYRVIGSSGDCRDTASVVVVVRAVPIVDAGEDVELCPGESTQLAASGGIIYHWSPDKGLNCADCSNPLASPKNTTLYHVEITDSNGCTATDSLTVAVLPKFTADAGIDRAICLGDTTELAASDGAIWQWSPVTDLSCTDCRNPNVSPKQTTIYRVTITNGSGCQAGDSVVVTVHPLPTVDAGNDAEICVGQSVQLLATGNGSFHWSPAAGLDCIDCATPLASPAETTTYHLEFTDTNGCAATDSMTVRVRTTASEAIASISRDHHVFPGQSVAVPIILNSAVDLSQVEWLRLTLSYSPQMLRLENLTFDSTILAGWIIDSSRKPGSIILTCTPPVGASLKGAGIVSVAHFTAFIGDSLASEIPFEIEADGGSCLVFRTDPGRITLDSVCGLSYRLIEIYGKRYALDKATPNPFNPTADIRFSLGLDGATRLVVYNSLGEEVAVLVDEYLQSGTYQATWNAAAFPDGLYYYRLTSGAWIDTGTMTLRK
jgi:PKD repeat protein